ncbi:hypothetical protein [Mesorhizobium marinum]|uniref:hypothetical protein n=1 Tax=Mesorhizobium marinum TaxID=3228790 RepID=UPI0034667168
MCRVARWLYSVAEIKKPGVGIGSEQKDQSWRYVKELRSNGLLTEAATTACYILGSKIDPGEGGIRTEWDGRVTIIPMTYNTFICRAEKRMLGLRDKLKEAPFLKEHEVDGDGFVTPPAEPQQDLLAVAGASPVGQP